MRFYTKQHQASWGIDLHARSLDVGVLHQDGDLVMHRTLPTRPDTFLRTVAPSRDALGGAGAGLCPWSWLAALWAPAGMPFVLGQARALHAIHGGQAPHAPSDAHTMAVLRRGGLRPQADVSPAERRATRDRWRRRMSLARTRAALLAHLQPPPRQDPVPARGTPRADTAHRAGGAARGPAPAGPQRLAGALARSGLAAKRPRRTRPSLGPGASPCPGSGNACAASCATRGLTSRGARGGRRVSPRAAWAQVPKPPPGHATAPRGRRAGPRPCTGPVLPPPSWCGGTLRPASHPARAWSTHTAQARPGPCGPSHGAVRLLLC